MTSLMGPSIEEEAEDASFNFTWDKGGAEGRAACHLSGVRAP